MKRSLPTTMSLSLIDAARHNQSESVQSLLQSGSVVLHSPEAQTAFCAATFEGHLTIVQAFVRHGIDINLRSNDMTALDCAIENTHLALVRYLLENGAHVNTADTAGTTPLHRAIDIEAESANHRYDTTGEEELPSTFLTEVLLSYGADVNARTVNGETPLDWARERHPKAVQILQRHRA